MMSRVSQDQQPKGQIVYKGILSSLLAIPLGALTWVLLWQFGFMAAVVAWGIAVSVVWLYKFGANAEVTPLAARYLIGIIIVGIVVAFLSGIVSDIWAAYIHEFSGNQGFFSAEFWNMVWINMTSGDFLVQYSFDLLITLAFAALGAGGVVRSLPGINEELNIPGLNFLNKDTKRTSKFNR